VRRDHRPYTVKQALQTFERFYVRHFIAPQLTALGSGAVMMRPWYIKVSGSRIEIGRNVTLMATCDQRIRLAVWPGPAASAKLVIRDNVIISPGVRISVAANITIDNNCMIANGGYITDSDWHGIYDRVSLGSPKQVHLEQNVWMGDHAMVAKGVTIGQNSIIGAGAVVVADIPANCVAAGNPAKVLKRLDPQAKITTRAKVFENPEKLAQDVLNFDRRLLAANTLFKWLRVLFFPRRGD
jgi:acetyltransferase-like isoleucine patch superfamily enzyme